jgi:hypothetical protein
MSAGLIRHLGQSVAATSGLATRSTTPGIYAAETGRSKGDSVMAHLAGGMALPGLEPNSTLWPSCQGPYDPEQRLPAR